MTITETRLAEHAGNLIHANSEHFEPWCDAFFFWFEKKKESRETRGRTCRRMEIGPRTSRRFRWMCAIYPLFFIFFSALSLTRTPWFCIFRFPFIMCIFSVKRHTSVLRLLYIPPAFASIIRPMVRVFLWSVVLISVFSGKFFDDCFF